MKKSRQEKKLAKPSQPLISLTHCSVVLGDHLALDDASFELRVGERWVLMGPNGAGKSVLLKILRGDMWPTPTGRERRVYHFDGESVTEPRGSKQHIAYLAPERQDRYVRYDWNLTVTQIVATGLFDEDVPLSSPNAQQRARVARLLRRFKIWSLRERRILSLSYGQRRRVLLARALAGEPRVLLLDEPFNGLDQFSHRILQSSLDKLSRGDMTWVLTTHRMKDIPRHATHFARMEKGSIVESRSIRGVVRTKRGAASLPTSAASTVSKEKPVDSSPWRRIVTPAKAGAGSPSSILIRLADVQLFRDYRPVLRTFDWEIRRGEHWAIMGRNGSGKSSLLLLLYGDLHPALGGRVERDGMQAGTPIAAWKKRVGFVSPELQAAHFRVGALEEIVASGLYASVGLNQAITTNDRRRARRWLEFFGIEHLHARGPRQVSYGQLRLALIARAMVNEPEVLLLDEPFTGLDPDMHRHAWSLVQSLTERGTQLIMAVHDRHDLVPAVKNILRIEQGGKVNLRTAPR